jgi:hypothetical protein
MEITTKGADMQAIESLAKLRGQWEALQASGLTLDETSEAMDAILGALTTDGPEAANRIFFEWTTPEGREAGSRWAADFMRAAA